jgi:hypothetical protein
MAYNFKLPRDLYYWGQNRLGSLMPLISYPIIRLTSIQPIFVLSFVQYIFLLIPAILISKYLKSKALIITLFVSIFLPVCSYRAILYIGHPYSAQLLCCTLFIYFCGKFYKLLNGSPAPAIRFKPVVYQFLAMFFLFLSLWISELSVVIVLIPFLYLIFDRNKQNTFEKKAFSYYSILFLFYIVISAFVLYKFKSLSAPDPDYDKAFLFDTDKLSLQFDLMRATFEDVLLFRDGHLIDNIFYYLLFFLIITFFFLPRVNTMPNWLKNFNKSVLITCLIAFVVLFFSSWNLRSNFCPRYYTPLYYLFIVCAVFSLDQLIGSISKTLFSIIFIFYSAYYSFSFLNSLPPSESAWTTYKSFRELPKGTLIAGYWDTYLIASVATKNLIPVTFDSELLRNKFMLKKALRNNNFYLLNTNDLTKFSRHDTLWQYYHSFIYTGKRYVLNGIEVLQYRKVK